MVSFCCCCFLNHGAGTGNGIVRAVPSPVVASEFLDIGGFRDNGPTGRRLGLFKAVFAQHSTHNWVHTGLTYPVNLVG